MVLVQLEWNLSARRWHPVGVQLVLSMLSVKYLFLFSVMPAWHQFQQIGSSAAQKGLEPMVPRMMNALCQDLE